MRLAVDQWGKVEALEGSSFQPKVRTSTGAGREVQQCLKPPQAAP